MNLLLFVLSKQKTAYEMRISDWSSDVCSSDLITRNMSPKIATHASAILSQSAIGKRRASNELSTNANAPANHSDWTTVSPFIAGPPTRHSPVRPLSAIRPQGLHNPSYYPYA